MGYIGKLMPRIFLFCSTLGMDATAQRDWYACDALYGTIGMQQYQPQSLRTQHALHQLNAPKAIGRIAMLAFLLSEGWETCTTSVMDMAATYHHLEIVKWLHASRTEGCTTEAMDMAAGNGNMDIIQCYMPIERKVAQSRLWIRQLEMATL